MIGSVKDTEKLKFHSLPLKYLQVDRFSNMADMFSQLIACVRDHRWS